MERLTVIYNDNSKLTVTNKRPGAVQLYYDRNVHGRPSVKSAVIQQYPKKKYPPVILVDNENVGAPVNYSETSVKEGVAG